jgi:cytochrome P450
MVEHRSDWNPFTAASFADPIGTDRHMRQTCPVAYTDVGGGFYALFKHADILEAGRDRDTYSSRTTIAVPKRAGGAPWVPLQADPPEHRLFRRVLVPFFARSRLATFEPTLMQITNELIDGWIDRGTVDIAKELCLAIPAQALCLLLGLPIEAGRLLHEWTGSAIEAAANGDTERSREIHNEMAAYGMAQLALRRAEPREDVLSAMLAADVGGRPMTDAELEGMFLLLAEAGHETTANALTTTVKYLAEHSDVRRVMAADEDAYAAAVEEFVRFASPVRALARTTTRDVEVRGRTIPAGSQVALMFSSGSHDEDQFIEPDVCDFTRDASSHTAFGGGIHRCIGEHLARLEMRIVIRELLRRIPDFELDGEPIKSWWATVGYRSLPIRFPVPASTQRSGGCAGSVGGADVQA